MANPAPADNPTPSTSKAVAMSAVRKPMEQETPKRKGKGSRNRGLSFLEGPQAKIMKQQVAAVEEQVETFKRIEGILEEMRDIEKSKADTMKSKFGSISLCLNVSINIITICSAFFCRSIGTRRTHMRGLRKSVEDAKRIPSRLGLKRNHEGQRRFGQCLRTTLFLVNALPVLVLHN